MIVVGYRDIDVGVDTATYVEIFQHIAEGYSSRFEPGFVLLTRIVSFFTYNTFYYFLIICAVVLLGYLLFFINLVGWRWGERRNTDIVLLLALLLASSWFVTSVINGVRQGMALPFAYMSLFLFFQKRFAWSFFSMAVSVGFHFSSLSLIPFFGLVFLRRIWLYTIVIISAILYPLGFWEFTIAAFSSFFGLPLHSFIASYGVEQGLWVGFQVDLFFYSVFWLIFLMAGEWFIRPCHLAKWRIVISMYLILLMPYFFLGFGGFSNRFGYIAWFFLPAAQAAFIAWSKFDVNIKLLMGFVLFFAGVYYFSSFFV